VTGTVGRYASLLLVGTLVSTALLVGAQLVGARIGLAGTRVDAASEEGVPVAASGGTAVTGLAAKYPNDVGLAKDPDVIFAEDFESWDGNTPPAGTWQEVSTEGTRRVSIVPGAVAASGPGKSVLELACWQEPEKSSSAGLSKHLGNYDNANEGLGAGYEEVYVRYYQKFDKGYTPGVANHGSLLGGRDVTRSDSRWVGMADTTDVASQGYYSACLQPYGGGQNKQPFHWGFYSYHCDKPDRWGDYFKPLKMATIDLDRWYCLEWHLKLNSAEPLKADAVEELWVDGQLSIHKDDLRYRKVPQLKITFFNLGTYYHPGLPAKYTAENPIKVYYDNLIIARKPVGPVVSSR
jgi:hypothetical protein